MLAIGSRIKKLRKERRLTQQELARHTDIARGNISNYEAGRFLPSAEAIVALAHFFGVTTDELLLGAKTSHTAAEEELLFIYRRLAGARQQELLDFARFVLAQSKDTPGKPDGRKNW